MTAKITANRIGAPAWPGTAAPAGVLLGTLLLALAGCGGPKGDQYRSVKVYDYASCDSTPVTGGDDLEAIHRFEDELERKYFLRRDDRLLAANHEDSEAESGLREYRGPFYVYVHPMRVAPEDARRGVQWQAMLYLHGDSVRVRHNGGEWGEWQTVRTRNFTDQGRTTDGLGRWRCLVKSEFAWAQVTRTGTTWTVEPQTVSLYDQPEFDRLLPLPDITQADGHSPVPPRPKPAVEAGGY